MRVANNSAIGTLFAWRDLARKLKPKRLAVRGGLSFAASIKSPMVADFPMGHRESRRKFFHFPGRAQFLRRLAPL